MLDIYHLLGSKYALLDQNTINTLSYYLVVNKFFSFKIGMICRAQVIGRTDLSINAMIRLPPSWCPSIWDVDHISFISLTIVSILILENLSRKKLWAFSFFKGFSCSLVYLPRVRALWSFLWTSEGGELFLWMDSKSIFSWHIVPPRTTTLLL